MYKYIIAIIRKELYHFWKDRRMVISIFIPGVILYIMYSILGANYEKHSLEQENYIYNIKAVNESCYIDEKLSNFEISYVDESSIAQAKSEIEKQDIDVLICFSDDFDKKVEVYNQDTNTEAAPNIEIYFNSSSDKSMKAYSLLSQYFMQIEASMINKFDMNNNSGTQYDLASEKDTMASVLAMMLPMLLVLFLFNGCLSSASESIAGEKERGTLATLLVTPVKRQCIVIGKMISLSTIGIISGISSFIGILFALPKLLKGLYAKR